MNGGLAHNAMSTAKSCKGREPQRAKSRAWQKLFENVPVGMCRVGLDGRVLQANPAMIKLAGYSEAEISRMNVKDLLRDGDEVERLFEKIVSDAPGCHAYGKLIRKDGSFTPAYLTGSRVILSGSEAILLTAIDITPRSEVQASLERAEHSLDETEQALNLKSIALAEVVHQIEADKNALRENIAANIRDLILPIVEKLRLTDAPAEMIDMLESALREITNRFSIQLFQAVPNLSSRESEITRMIHCGLTSKQIARLLGISQETVEKHRRNIRKKVGISGQKVNLASFLNSAK